VQAGFTTHYPHLFLPGRSLVLVGSFSLAMLHDNSSSYGGRVPATTAAATCHHCTLPPGWFAALMGGSYSPAGSGFQTPLVVLCAPRNMSRLCARQVQTKNIKHVSGADV